MNSETKKEFLQKYKLDSYSRAIPARTFSGKTASLAEYCEPIDSRKVHRSTSEGNEDYNSDPEKRYAQPQDAIEVKKVKQSKSRIDSIEFDDGDVYELAQQPAEDNVLPQKKPSPKPRSAKHSSLHQQNSAPTSTGVEPETAIEVTQKNNLKMSPASGAKTQGHKKRPGKKVVEIEYEVASEIRLNKPGESSSGKGMSGQDQGSSKTNINPDKYVQLASHSSTQTTKGKPQESPLNSASVTSAPAVPQSSPLSTGQAFPPPIGTEDAYEEPWDLKMKRLKQEQEQEKKGKRLAKRSDKLPGMQKTAAVYESTWDKPSQQQKFDKRMSCARSLSQTSEVEVFHDALENFADQKVDSAESVESDQNSHRKLKPVPQNTYEDAWDLKNSILEQKIREMQLQASAIYEEPWDSSKQQKQLQAKLCGNSPSPIVCNDHPKLVRQRSSIEAQDAPVENTEPNPSVAKGKHYSYGEMSAKSRSHGCSVGQRINPMIPLASQNWYHGNISREDAEKMLCVCKEGSYIVRISSDRRSYSLSIKSAKQYIHVQIDQRTNDDGSVCYILGKNSKEFCTIPEMIDYYTHHRVPLKGAEHITLLHPVECKWS